MPAIYDVPRMLVEVGESYPADADGFRIAGAWWATQTIEIPAGSVRAGHSLAVLGEPGVGKTTTIKQIVASRNAAWVPLDEADSATEFIALLKSTAATLADKPMPHLILDGLDECPLPTKTLLRRLGHFLEGTSTTAILGCRSASWTNELAEMMAGLRPDFCAYELLPMSLDDIRMAAEVNGVSSPEFVQAVRDTGAAALAMRPLTLNMLIDVYKRSGQLPDDVAELFATGLQHLADEYDKTRSPGSWTTEHRLATAERLAASLLVAGAASVTTLPPMGVTEIPVGALSAGVEEVASGEFEVTASLVGETLQSGLFQGRGPHRFSPSHATFAGFLTARYIIRRGLTEEQVRSLLTRRGRVGNLGLPSHLRETGAWLVSMAPDQFSWLVEVDAAGLLSHTAYVRDAGCRRVLVDQLLSDPDLATSTRYTKWRLSHPGLTAQLSPALNAPLSEDAGEDFGHPVSRTAATAIGIARGSRAVQVSAELAALVSATHVNPYLRARAAMGLADLSPDLAATALRPILDEVTEHPERDPDDELRGIALRACLPGMTGDQVADFLIVPRRDNYVGSYAFLLSDLGNLLTDAQVASLAATSMDAARRFEDELEKATEQGEDSGSNNGHAIMPGIVTLLDHRRTEGLLDQLTVRLLEAEGIEEFPPPNAAWLVCRGIRSGSSTTIPQSLLEPIDASDPTDSATARRRTLGLAVAQALPKNRRVLITRPVRAPRESSFGESPVTRPLLGHDDFEWLLDPSVNLDPELRAALTRWTYDPESPRHVQLAWDHRADPNLGWIAAWFAPVSLDSEEAKHWRELFSETSHEWPERDVHEDLLRNAWDRVQGGDLGAVAEVVARLRVDPTTGTSNTFPTGGILDWPGFRILSIDRGDLVEACAGYLQTATPPETEWLSSPGLINSQVIELYAMLRLLAESMPEVALLERLAESAWVALAPVIIRSYRVPYKEDSSPDAALIRALQHRAPDALRIGCLELLKQHLGANGDTVPPVWPLATVFDPMVETELEAAAKALAGRLDVTIGAIDEQLKASPGHAQEATTLSASRQHAQNLSHSLRRVLEVILASTSLPSGLHDLASEAHCGPARAISAVEFLLHDQIGWEEVWSVAMGDEAMIVSLVDEIALRMDWAEHGQRLLRTPSEGDLVDLWEWIEAHATVGGHGGHDAVDVEARHLRDLQDGILAQLARRSNDDSLNAFATLEASHPLDWNVKQRRQEAVERYRDETWEGTRVEDFMRVIANATLTVVHDDESLFRLLQRLLASLQERISQGVGELLWNELPIPKGSPKGTQPLYRPKNEAQIQILVSDHLKAELARGIVVNREVQVRDTTSKGHGLAVDVLASAGQVDKAGRLPVCPIEVKGNWNPKLMTDLRNQLVDDYMKDLDATFGIYVCGWFDVDQWSDTSDQRRKMASKRDVTTVEAELHESCALAARERRVEVDVMILKASRNQPSGRSVEVK